LGPRVEDLGDVRVPLAETLRRRGGLAYLEEIRQAALELKERLRDPPRRRSYWTYAVLKSPDKMGLR
jgi:hypothetical protein